MSIFVQSESKEEEYERERVEIFDMTESNISSRKKRWEILMFVSLAAGILWTVASRVPSAVGAPLSSAPSPREGFLAPDFKLDTMDGNKVTLSELRGKIVVIN